ncbi:MAG: hypothetical protein H0S80_05370 [Desulfovibrionaceae bacterium]|nr:hypothetical protein [Desulfovibrionaceae bacterium]
MNGPVLFIVFGVIAGVVLNLSLKRSLQVVWFGSLVVVGLFVYLYDSILLLKWVISGIGLTYLVKYFGSLLLYKGRARIFSPAKWTIAFIIYCLVVSVVNGGYEDLIWDFKNYFQSVGILLCLSLPSMGISLARSFFSMLLFVALVQVPVAVYQYKSLASELYAGDRIVGTFGNGVNAIGDDSFLSTFMALLLVFSLSLFLKRKLSFFKAILLTSLFVIPILLTNTKMVIFYLFIGGVFVFIDGVKDRPLLSIFLMATFGLLVLGVGYYHYSKSYLYNQYLMTPGTVEEYVDRTLEYNTKNLKGEDLNRISVLLHWWKEHPIDEDWFQALFGHGVGASKIRGHQRGSVASSKRYIRYSIGLTTLSRFLWDIGVVGVLLYLMIMWSTFRIVLNLLLKCDHIPSDRSRLLVILLAIVVNVIHMAYKPSLLSNQAYSIFMYSMLGFSLTYYADKIYEKQVG